MNIPFELPLKIIPLVAKWRKERLAKRNRLFGKYWNNQGQKILKPTHYIDLELWANGKQFEGRFNVCYSSDEERWELFKMKGNRKLKTLECQIFKSVNGIQIPVASGTFKRTECCLLWQLNESLTDQFPKEAVLQIGFPNIA